MGMGMAMNAGGMNPENLYAMGQQQAAQKNAQQSQQQAENSWKCSCGATVNGNFCPECGAKEAGAGCKWSMEMFLRSNGNRKLLS